MLLYRNSIMNVKKVRSVSGASRKKSKIGFSLLLNKLVKTLSTRVSWKAGISSFGRRTVKSKGKKTMTTKAIKCSYRPLDKSVHFHHSYLFTAATSKLYSLIFSSSGKISYIRNSFVRLPFQLYRTNCISTRFNTRYNTLGANLEFMKFSISSASMLNLKFMSKVNNLQISLKQDIQYSRAEQSYSTILKKNLQFFSVVVKLPSGVKKIFSVFSLCSKQESQSSFKNFLYNSSSKNLYAKGLSPRTRGVAKNPVDHPHGGRTKSIKYPRTPWGKTTKFK